MKTDQETKLVSRALEAVLGGAVLDAETIYALADVNTPDGRKALLDAAAAITARFCERKFDSCSIINARSGRCSENCKWCAQSGHYSTGCETYDIVDHDEARHAAQYNARAGVKHFSLVASGRALKGRHLQQVCDLLREINDNDGIATCASLGLLDREGLEQLRAAGVRRYHCNLETAPSYFPSLCTTHTTDDKMATINTARELGFEICSGGIIGMGESPRQRAELALKLREVCPVSIPLNVLCPIPGTPLEHAEPISEADILHTVAVFRFAHPQVHLRFAGGRSRMSREGQLEALRVGINAGIVGDLLTTIGSTIAQDRQLCSDAGYEF